MIHYFHKLPGIFGALLLTSVTPYAPAEPNDAQRNLAANQRASNTAATNPSALSEEIPAMEGDEEFGEQVIVERVSNWYPFYLDVSVSGYRTTNAELSDRNPKTDTYLRESAVLSYTQNVSGNLLFDFGLEQETYRYRNIRSLDFDYLRAHTGVMLYLQPDQAFLDTVFGNGFLFANYSYYRITDGLFGSEAFTNHSGEVGFQKSVPIIKGHQIYYGISSDLSGKASNRTFQRNEHRAYLGYFVEWTEDLSMRAGYVATLFDYENTTQSDWGHNLDAAVDMVVARPEVLGQECEVYLEGNAFFNLNDSNLAGQDYEYFNWGGGFGIRSSF